MNILFDLSSTQPLIGNDFHGGSEYAKTVFYRLCELLPDNASLEVFYNPDKNIDPALLEMCIQKNFTVNRCKNNNDISRLLCDKKYNIFYSALPYSYSDLEISPETKFIYTFHGLRFLEYPVDKYEIKYKKNGKKKEKLQEEIKHSFFLFFPFWWKILKQKKYMQDFNKLFSLTENQTIITVSNHSKFSIAYFFPQVDISKVKVLYSPPKRYNTDTGKSTDILNSFLLKTGKYILLICGDRSEKGAYRACRVLNNLIKKHDGIPQDIKILVLGVSYKKPFQKLTNSSNRFVFHDYVSTEELEMFYKNACLFLYPTMNEGFGYPPQEAMKYGILCACSANSSITEIYGDSILYFNPHDEIEMGIRILQSFDDTIRNEKYQKILLRHKLIAEKQEQDLNLLIREITGCHDS